MKKILTLLTGGTIGSETKNGIIDVKKEDSDLVGHYLQNGRSDVAIDSLRIMDILSENADIEDLVTIVNAIAETDTSAYCGIVVAYGTDTLAYAAAFAAMALPSYPLPIIFVASDKPLDEEGANGHANFESAIDFIMDAGYCGVYVCYKNIGEAPCIHLGSRIMQSQALTGNFASVGGVCLGEMQNARFVPRQGGNPLRQQIVAQKSNYHPIITKKAPFVLYIKPCPGADFAVYDLERIKPLAVVVELYHSGTACVDGSTANLADFIRRCKKEGIPVVLASYPYTDGRRYASTKILEEAGGIFACRMSVEAAYAKTLVYFLRDISQSLDNFMAKNIFFEILD